MTENFSEVNFFQIDMLGGEAWCIFDGSDLFIDFMIVDEPGVGKGKELAGLVLAAALDLGANTLTGHFVTPESLGSFVSGLGNEHLEFRSKLNKNLVHPSIGEVFSCPELYLTTKILK